MQAQAAPSHPCPSCGDPLILPWRDKSLWRITTTKTVKGFLREKPFESTKVLEEFSEPMTKKHAMEYAKLMKEYEEDKDRDMETENETKKEDEGKDQVWKIKTEEILAFMKEMRKEDDKGEQVEIVDPLRKMQKTRLMRNRGKAMERTMEGRKGGSRSRMKGGAEARRTELKEMQRRSSKAESMSGDDSEL